MNTIATDLDGTIYLNNEIIPGVIESLLDLDKHNLKIIFITNNSSQAPMEICNKLEKLLLRDIDLDQIVTPLVILKQYLENKNMNIYVHGSENLSNFVNSIANVTTNIDESQMVLIGRKEKYTQLEVNNIMSAYQNGSNIYALNKDLTFPINEFEFEEGNGAIVKEIEKLLDIEIESFGKPDKFYSNFLNKNFNNIAYVIGDRVDTDILLANKINAKSYLVNSSIQNYLSDEIADFKFDKFSDCISSIIKNLQN